MESNKNEDCATIFQDGLKLKSQENGFVSSLLKGCWFQGFLTYLLGEAIKITKKSSPCPVGNGFSQEIFGSFWVDHFSSFGRRFCHLLSWDTVAKAIILISETDLLELGTTYPAGPDSSGKCRFFSLGSPY